jgi:uncharacterized transporter YbjL
MIAVVSLLVVVTLSLLVTRIATIALSHTGLSREASRFQARSSLLHLATHYPVSELEAEELDWLADRTLQESSLREEKVLVLGIPHLDSSFVGAPEGSTCMRAGDTLLLYGRVSALEALDRRGKGRRGDAEHEAAVAEQDRVVEEQRREVARAEVKEAAVDGPAGGSS